MKFDAFKRALIGEWREQSCSISNRRRHLPLFPLEIVRQARGGGSFLQFDYDWTYKGAEQSGVLLFVATRRTPPAPLGRFLSYELQNHVVHRNRCRRIGRTERFLCSAARTGLGLAHKNPLRSQNEFTIVMHNISPEAQEDLAVEIDYTRNA